MYTNKHNINSQTNSRCICLERQTDNPQLLYSRFAISPLLPGQSTILGTAIRKSLFSEVEGTAITSVDFSDTVHEYANLPGVRESIHDILLNIRDIVIQTDSKQEAGYLHFEGPGPVTAKHIHFPPSVRIIDETQYIAHAETSAKIIMNFIVKKGKGWRLQTDTDVNASSSIFQIDSKFSPVKHVNYSTYSLGADSIIQELLMLEIWTNGAMTPEKALSQASTNLASLLRPFYSMN